MRIFFLIPIRATVRWPSVGPTAQFAGEDSPGRHNNVIISGRKLAVFLKNFVSYSICPLSLSVLFSWVYLKRLSVNVPSFMSVVSQFSPQVVYRQLSFWTTLTVCSGQLSPSLSRTDDELRKKSNVMVDWSALYACWFVGAGSGWPHNALWYHNRPTSC